MMKAFLLFVSLSLYHSLQAQIITTIAGTGIPGYSGDGGPATAAQFFVTGGVVVDTGGNVYISDSHPVIRRVNTAGIINTIAGNDTAGFSGDNGPATAAKIHTVTFIAVDNKGNVYFSDVNVGRVRKVDKWGIITTFAGATGSSLSGMGGPATAAVMAGGGLTAGCLDDTGNLYIGSMSYIFKVDTFGIIRIFAGTGIAGHSHDGSRADTSRIEVGAQMAMDINNNLYYTESDLWVRKISTTGIITTVAGNGTFNYTGDGGPATAAGFSAIAGIFPDQCGNLYIADTHNNRVRVVNGSGFVNTFAGTGFGGIGSGSITGYTGGYTGDGGAATAAEIYGPEGIFVDKHGSVYFSDAKNNVIRYVHMDSCKNTTASPSLSKGEEVLRVFPNPAVGGMFTFNLSTAITEKANVVITDIVGKQVAAFITETNKEMEVGIHAPAGVYFINVVTPSGRWEKKIVIE